MKTILLTFDVEEFDIPLEYGQFLPMSTQLAIGKEGTEIIGEWVEKQGYTATFYTTAHFASHHSSLMQSLAKKHEIASHALYHSTFDPSHLQTSREVLQSITGQPIHGFRMPRLQKIDTQALLAAGYTYDSSLNPTWIPGRYNHWRAPRTVHTQEGLIVLPTSVTPYLRIPLFWLSIKNFPLVWLKQACAQTLAHDRVLHLYFHPWEFVDLRYFSLPFFVKKPSGKEMLQKLTTLMAFLSEKGQTTTTMEYIRMQRL